MIRPLSALLVIAALVALAGCGEKVIGVRVPPVPKAPEPSTPAAAVERLQWGWSRRDTLPCQDLFAADFRFRYFPSDTDTTLSEWFRDTELECSRHLFVTGFAGRAAATSIEVVLSPALVDVPSPVPGHDARFHREIATLFSAAIRVPGGDWAVAGVMRFGLVRGDSAKIPQLLIDRGYRPDSTRWWIESWTDETTPSSRPGDHATLARLVTLGMVKRLYVEAPPPATAARGARASCSGPGL